MKVHLILTRHGYCFPQFYIMNSSECGHGNDKHEAEFKKGRNVADHFIAQFTVLVWVDILTTQTSFIVRTEEDRIRDRGGGV